MIEKINVFDNHDQAYYLWKKAGISGAAVIHIDAHHDLFEPKGTNAPVISDYLRWALREGILREVYWVVPEHIWHSNSSRGIIWNHLKAMARTSGGANPWFKPNDRQGGISLYDQAVTVCSLESLPKVEHPFLLDVDVDYLLIKEAPLISFHRVPERPWIWPADLAPLLSNLALAAEMVTICYSISGGFVTLQWKHLGDDLASILASNQKDDTLKYANLKRQMAEALLNGDVDLHSKLREDAEKQNRQDASLHHWRALAHRAQGDINAARKAQATAIELDPTYKHSFGFGGLIYEAHGDFDAAERAYRLATDLNENDAMGWYGLGRIALRNGNFENARMFLSRAASFVDKPAEVHRELGALAEVTGNMEEALKEYRCYLRTAFAGRSLERPIACVPHRDFRSPFWAEGYAAMARIYSAQGNQRLCRNCYSEALKFANPRLYSAIRPILRKMGGAKDITLTDFLMSLVRSMAIGISIGVRHVRRRIKLKLLTPADSSATTNRFCPPVRITRQIRN
ncbi:MAG: tetratricopeptide repeat protein [Armatimonadota bacterium]|nr:tetratricopeptide repeat protein [Armatimonadota bacterium]